MWKPSKPSVSAETALNVCISKLEDANLKARLEAVSNLITLAENQYSDIANQGSLHLVVPGDLVGSVSKTEMSNLYNRQMVGGPGRAIYDKIMSIPEHDRCPLCGHGSVASLDHFLPKKSYPALSITPINLVPCCSDCNKAKGDKSPLSADKFFIAPYFDDVTDFEWLFARLTETSPPTASYYVSAPDDCDSNLKGRIEYHFATLKLAKLYANQANRQLQNMRGALTDFYQIGGAIAVKEDLERHYR